MGLAVAGDDGSCFSEALLRGRRMDGRPILSVCDFVDDRGEGGGCKQAREQTSCGRSEIQELLQ